MYRVQKNQEEIIIEILEKKIKNTYFKIKNDRVIVSKNRYVKNETVINYVYDNFERIKTKMNSINETKKLQIKENEIILFNEVYQIEFQESDIFSYLVNDHLITLNYPIKYDIFQAKTLLKTVLLKNKIKELEQKIKPKLDSLGIRTRPYVIKVLKSKYGSYHRIKDEITINLCMIEFSEIYLEYVLFHEYAHTLVFNHQKAFYDVLDKMMPGHKEIQKSLRKHHI